MRLFRAAALFLLVLLVVATPAGAQFDTATVLGTVTDSTGAVIPGCNLTLRSTATGVIDRRTSNGAGGYQFTGVLPGNYELTATSQGFTTEKTTFSVTVGALQRVDLKMRLGGTTQTVTVAGIAAQLQTDTSNNSFTITTNEVLSLPLNGREYSDLATLTPGVKYSPLSGQTSTSVDASYDVNGLTATLNNFTLDGLNNNSYSFDKQGYSQQASRPVLDAVDEFSVTTDNYSAEYGRVGGAVINVATKSGTEHFRGDVWDFIRNPAANAVGPFPLSAGSVPGPHQNQFGGTFGGPLPLGKLTRGGRTFFFADYEGVRNTQRAPDTATVPTAAQLNSVLNGAPFLDSEGNVIKIENPYTLQIYSNGVIPAPIEFAQIVLQNLEGVANVAGQTAVASSNYTSSPASYLTSDTGAIRGDWHITSNQSFFARYDKRDQQFNNPSPIPAPDYGKSNGLLSQNSQQVMSGYDKVLTPQSALALRIGFNWNQNTELPFDLGTNNIPVEAGIPNAPTDPTVAGGLPEEDIDKFTDLGRTDSSPTQMNPFAIDWDANYSWLHSRHSLKFGVEQQYIYVTTMHNHPQDGYDIYKGLFSEGSMKAGKLSSGSTDPAYAQAWALADFAFGARSEYNLSNNVTPTDTMRYTALYAQDDWRARPNLTLNLGLRYEYMTPMYTSNNGLSNFDPSTQQLVLASSGSMYNRALVNPNRFDYGPRVGFSYSLNPKTVIRGGYGIAYILDNRDASDNELALNIPFAVSTTVSQYASSATTSPQALCTSPQTQAIGSCFVTTQQGYPNDMIAPPSAPYNLQNFVPNYIPARDPWGYLQSFQLDIQREFTSNLLLSVAYVGNRGEHEFVLGDLNQATPNNAAGTLTLASRRPFACCGDIQDAFDEDQSYYNSLQTKLEKRYAGGLYFINSFTWSHAIDMAAGGKYEDVNGDVPLVNIYNMRGDRGRSGYDQPINETLALTYDLPFGQGRRFGAGASPVLRAIESGWQANFINSDTSGLPDNLTYTPTVTQEVDDTELSSYYRANLSGNPVLPAASRVKTAAYYLYLNSANVTAPTANNQPFGTAGRNAAMGPIYNDLDVGLQRRFRFSETSALSFRVEAFNSLNHVNYQAPDGDVSDTTFGQITTAYPARVLQGALKLFF